MASCYSCDYYEAGYVDSWKDGFCHYHNKHVSPSGCSKHTGRGKCSSGHCGRSLASLCRHEAKEAPESGDSGSRNG